jgi:hypothetical protein
MKHIQRIARLIRPFTMAAAMACMGTAQAAPLDALLDANPQARYGQGLLEVSVDRMNQSLDVFKLRGADLALGDNTGDYQGGTLRAGLSLAPTVWVDGALQRRKLTYGPDQPHIGSWRLGAQWQFLPAQTGQPTAALRLSAWGNQAAQVSKSTPTALPGCIASLCGIQASSLSVNDANDRSFQADLVGTWPLGPVSLSAFAGAGQGKVTVGSITANISGFPLTYSHGTFGAGLDSLVPQSFNTELQATNYNTRTAQAGFNLAYTTGPWSLRGGYALQHIQRTAVDDVISAKGKTPYSLNHTLVGELAYKLTPRVVLFTRGQAMSNQFLTEIPFLYNSLTSQRFDQRYGVLSVGLGAVFD